MEVSFASKNVPLTDSLKTFITSKLSKLSKFSSSKLKNLQIILDIDSRKKRTNADAVVELVGEYEGKPLIVRESGKNFYSAFYGAFDKMKTRLTKERRLLVR